MGYKERSRILNLPGANGAQKLVRRHAIYTRIIHGEKPLAQALADGGGDANVGAALINGLGPMEPGARWQVVPLGFATPQAAIAVPGRGPAEPVPVYLVIVEGTQVAPAPEPEPSGEESRKQ